MEEAEEDLASKMVCSDCVGETYLSARMRSTGCGGTCAYCGTHDSLTWHLEDLAEEMRAVFEHSWHLTPSEPSAFDYAMGDLGRRGEPPVDIVGEVALVEPDIASDVVSLLNDGYFVDPKDPDDEALFGEEARYELCDEGGLELHMAWEEMKRELHHRARFFNRYLAAFLSELFAGIDKVRGRRGPAVKVLRAGGEKRRFLFRARCATSSAELEAVLKGVPATLGPPSGRLARAGRMNAAGISVFYGALDRDTCLAEVRPPVGSSVIVGKFELIRDLRVRDVRTLEETMTDKSPFDPEFKSTRRKHGFLRSLSRRLSSPVLPGDETFDYLLTQAVCEYLATVIEPRLDGILFPSSQKAGKGNNVTLFTQASMVEPSAYPKGTEISISTSTFDEDQARSFTAFVEQPEPSESAPTALGAEEELALPDFDYLGPPDTDGTRELNRQPTLRLKMQEIEVIDIKSVSYGKKAHPVSWDETKRTTRRKF